MPQLITFITKIFLLVNHTLNLGPTMSQPKTLTLCVVFLTLCAVRWSNAQPLIPFQTSFSHSEHHWILWTPNHPVYEAIEVRGADGTPGKSIRVFFTERAGGKKQVFYFNEESLAKRFRHESHYRDIEYRADGQPGKPLDLFVKFKDKNDQTVELTMKFAAQQELTSQYAGLTDQMGHGADSSFLVFYREKTASMTTNKLVIGGEDFSLTPELARGTQLFWRSGYRSNIYVATIAYGKAKFTWDQNELTSSFRRVFKIVSETKNEVLYRSNLFEDRTVIELMTNSNGEIRQYKHLLGPHVFLIDFDPALPTVKSARNDQVVKYSTSLDGFTNLVQGLVAVRKQNDTIEFDWQHDSPAWTRNYHFTSIIRPTADGGYDLEVATKRRK